MNDQEVLEQQRGGTTFEEVMKKDDSNEY